MLIQFSATQFSSKIIILILLIPNEVPLTIFALGGFRSNMRFGVLSPLVYFLRLLVVWFGSFIVERD